MNFSLSEDHELLSNSLRRYFADNYDIETRNRTAYASPYHSDTIWSQLAELGTVGAFISEEQGGFAGTAMDVAVVFEELGRSLCAEPMLGVLMSLRLLAKLGRGDLVEAIVAGEERCAFAAFEPNVACDLSHVETRARRKGDAWLLTGRKSAVYGAPAADRVVVVARTEQGLGLFLVDKPALIPAGMIDGGSTAELVLDDLPAECLSADALEDIEAVLDLGRIALCAEAVGAMSRLIDMTIDYLKQRKQFGRAIATFQALQHRIVDMVV
ncbi:partial L-prolyl-[peptidyl-carrier protein] dehydrogenase, partial [Gammaproteobacteria bacterium]